MAEKFLVYGPHGSWPSSPAIPCPGLQSALMAITLQGESFYEANRDIINDPDRLRAGMELAIPLDPEK
ncbi:hypothetical protein [Nitrosococcus wardiae]|uniref:hypothetical protein n=1 Tax=Nitrosococcus wardiae TaxID=1814290 RepID=UPI00141B37C0|nr:hypothetical protein [Nitrosococcus wardiae]